MALQTLLDSLNDAQRHAATIPPRHALVLAGAGSGKTRTIIARAAYLIWSGVPADRILILTFTRRAASEIVERVRGVLGDHATELRASTFHTWCMSLLRRAPHTFRAEGVSVIDQDDQLALFRLVRSLRQDVRLPQAAQLASMYSYARNTGQTLTTAIQRQASELLPLKQEIGAALSAYEQHKAEYRYLDYDDVLARVAESMAQSAAIGDWVANHYDHILVDEMQDTNPLQWQLLNPLQRRVTLFCVGDDAQSIYGFRGADFRNVHQFGERVPGSITLRLEQNYRSTQPILDLANWLLEQSPLGYARRLVAMRGAGVRPRVQTFSNEFEEGRWIAEDCAQRRQEGAAWRDHMILVRSGYIARPIEVALLDRGIPYRFIGGTRLFESAHMRDLLAPLRIVANPRDELAWMRFLTLWPGIGDVHAARIIKRVAPVAAASEGVLGIAAGELPADAHAALRQVHQSQEQVSQAIASAAAALQPVLEARYRNNDWERRRQDFPMVEELARRYTSLLGFIEEYLLNPIWESNVDRLGIEDAVTVITIHSAKGTECRVCYVAGVSPGNYPSARSVDDPDEVEEERRVLYVALTRAQDELIITRRMRSQWSRRSRQHDPAERYLLNDLPRALIDEVSHDGAPPPPAAPAAPAAPTTPTDTSFRFGLTID
jgi:DNA helicase-2/ATP-dependent DNA helicase PcrA